MERGPGSMASCLRAASLTSTLRRFDCFGFVPSLPEKSGMSIASVNWYHAAFVFATCTFHVTSALSAVTSPRTAPLLS